MPPIKKNYTKKRYFKPKQLSILDRFISTCLHNRFITIITFALLLVWGLYVSPFDWSFAGIKRNPVPVDAIPDIGENQQIVFTQWEGRSPQDIEDQVTYPLTVSLMGLPGVKTVRSISMFGFSTIYIIFEDNIDFYWGRSRILEKLSSIPADMLPEGVKPVLGPDATGLGQVFWYTLEGRSPNGSATGGWDLQELRSIQDWTVRYALLSANGVSEVASIGGFVKEYQIDLDPDAMRAHKINIADVYKAVRKSNSDVGARTLEFNNAEYVIRGLGYVKNLKDLEDTVVKVNENVPVYLKNIANIAFGPAYRRGILDKAGVEVVGGVVVVRYGENPLQVIKNVKEKIKEISKSLPSKTLSDGTISKVEIVPFYDRTGLIHETLGTLNKALVEEILITILVILLMVRHFRSALIISGVLPAAVLLAFVLMKLFHVDANIVALSGIAIAIGTVVDMGIVVTENILQHLGKKQGNIPIIKVIFNAVSEVSGAIMTSVATTIISFIPVFTLQYAEGKLFRPLAYTKTFTLFTALLVTLFVIPILAYWLLGMKERLKQFRKPLLIACFMFGMFLSLTFFKLGLLITCLAAWFLISPLLPELVRKTVSGGAYIIAFAVIMLFLSAYWLPIGPEKGLINNTIFAALPLLIFLGFFALYQLAYPAILQFCLKNKLLFFIVPLMVIIFGAFVWLGASTCTSKLPGSWQNSALVNRLKTTFPGLGHEFMPALDEGSFLFMPTTMPHASVSEVQDILQKQDIAMSNLPEVYGVVGKAGRVESALDPAPMSMIETVINYYPEYLKDENGNLLRFKFNPHEKDFFRDMAGKKVNAPDGKPYLVLGKFSRNKQNLLIPSEDGNVFRLWRPALKPELNPGRKTWPGINSPDDIWQQIVKVADVPGSTSAPKLQPIETRLVMLQSGMRAKMGLKISAPDLQTLDKAALILEAALKKAPSVEPATVTADRIVGKPYLEIKIDRQAIARYGIMLKDVQEVIEHTVGGKPLSTSVEGRERYPIRVRYSRELRDNLESLQKILITAPNGAHIPLAQLATIEYRKGPQSIKSEDSFLVGYVFFDQHPGLSELEVVNQAKEFLNHYFEKHPDKQLPAGVSYVFAGSYENQIRANQRLMIIIPVALIIIFVLLMMQFKSFAVSLLVFMGIAVSWGGGFIMLWLYGQAWFMDFSLFGVNLQQLFHISPVNLSVAVWVGFLALFGIATDDGVVMATYIKENLNKKSMRTSQQLRQAIIEAGKRRIRPCLMTTATTIVALIPILTSTGRGADIMIPMAIPVFGGMIFEVLTTLVVPVCYSLVEEVKLRISPKQQSNQHSNSKQAKPQNPQKQRRQRQ